MGEGHFHNQRPETNPRVQPYFDGKVLNMSAHHSASKDDSAFIHSKIQIVTSVYDVYPGQKLAL